LELEVDLDAVAVGRDGDVWYRRGSFKKERNG